MNSFQLYTAIGKCRMLPRPPHLLDLSPLISTRFLSRYQCQPQPQFLSRNHLHPPTSYPAVRLDLGTCPSAALGTLSMKSRPGAGEVDRKFRSPRQFRYRYRYWHRSRSPFQSPSSLRRVWTRLRRWVLLQTRLD